MSRLALKQGPFSTILMSTQGCSTRSGSARLAWRDEKLGQSCGSKLANNTNLTLVPRTLVELTTLKEVCCFGGAIRFWPIAFLRHLIGSWRNKIIC
jgi:hypothetical protein